MDAQFYILLSLKTPSGFETYGQYFLGNKREFALDIFGRLKGKEIITDKAMLHLDFMEIIDDLPVKVKTKCCTLDELALNCMFIAKETFRLYNLKELKH